MSFERKIVLGLIVLVMIIGVMWVKFAFAFQNEPNSVALYSVLPDEKYPKRNTILVTMGSRLAAAAFFIDENTPMAVLMASLSKKYGPPTRYTNISALWEGQMSTIECIPDSGLLVVYSTPGLKALSAVLYLYLLEKT